MNKSNRVEGYDFIRCIAIMIVFSYHILNRQSLSVPASIILYTLQYLAMPFLGFISGALLSSKNYDYGYFLAKRFARIYIPLFLCLALVTILHIFVGKTSFSQHTLLHFMGFTAFFKLFGVQSKAAIGHGLWFVTTIIVMYLLLPMLEKLFKHPHGLWNLIGVIVLSIVLDLTMWGTENIYPVVISFSLGAYVVFSGRLDRVLRRGLISSSILGAILLVIAGLSASGVFPLAIQKVILAPLYPLAFVPLLFAVVRKLPTPILTASSFFAGLSYEFYILHFYFINDELKSFVPYNMGLAAHITTAFFITLFLSYVLSRVAVPLRQLTESYFVQSHKDSSLT